MNIWLAAAAVLVVALVPLLAVAARAGFLAGLVALEVAGTLTAAVLLLVAEGTNRQAFADLALVLAVVSLAGAFAFVRYLEREG